MAKIIFIRTAPYEYKIANKSLYASFDLVARRLYEPEIQKNLKLPNIIKPNYILCSPRKRSIQTAEAIRKKFNLNNKIYVTPLLCEVLFSMSEFITKEKFYAKGIDFARARFVRAFVTNKLSEKVDDVEARAHKLLYELNKKSGIILCCSHGFFMKLIQLYASDNQIFKKPKQLINKFEPNKKPFDFCQVLEIDLETFNKRQGENVV